jgi:lipopolysaccharide transport system ATP-binding protein
MHIEYGGERHELPRGVLIGVIGDNGSGVGALLQAAGGRFLGPGHELNLSHAPLLCLGYPLDIRDAFTRCRFEADLPALLRTGATVLLASHDQDLLRRTSDEVWWVKDERVAMKGGSREVLEMYARHTAGRLRAAGAGSAPELTPSMRRGDGRARLLTLDVLDDAGRNTGTVMSGESMIIRVRVRYERPVPDPVIGIMIRTRVGTEVYGTNTELERVAVGPCTADEIRAVSFAFACQLCPGSYTVTAASHDPDGVWHDWLEDAVAFSVTDTRYTAGVANLKAKVTCSRE